MYIFVNLGYVGKGVNFILIEKSTVTVQASGDMVFFLYKPIHDNKRDIKN